MQAVSLVAPQTLNMYTYCGNDPINYVGPSGLFFGKLFKWIGKILKLVAIAVIVAVVIMSGPFAPATGTILAKILGGIVWLGAKVGMAANFISGGALLSAEAAAIGVISASLGSAALLAASTAAGAIGTYFQDGRVVLDPEARQQWNLARLTLLSLLNDPKSSCFKFLKGKIGEKAIKKIRKDLKDQVPYDWHTSTAPLKTTVFDSPKAMSDAMERDLGNKPEGALTDGYRGNIYYGGRSGLKVSTILHENIHRNVKAILNDNDLAEKLGTIKKGDNVFDRPEGSTAIDKTLEDAGCK